MLPSADSRLACLVILPSHLYGQSCLRAPLDSAAQLLPSCFYRDRERQWQSVSQDIKTSQVKWWRTRVCTITQHKIKASHAAQMWQMMCCWPSRCDMKGQTNVVLLPQDGTNSTISCFRCTASISGLQTCHSVHCTWCMVIWRDGLRRCTEPELGMTWPNSSTCVSILWAEQFTSVIKKKVAF